MRNNIDENTSYTISSFDILLGYAKKENIGYLKKIKNYLLKCNDIEVNADIMLSYFKINKSSIYNSNINGLAMESINKNLGYLYNSTILFYIFINGYLYHKVDTSLYLYIRFSDYSIHIASFNTVFSNKLKEIEKNKHYDTFNLYSPNKIACFNKANKKCYTKNLYISPIEKSNKDRINNYSILLNKYKNRKKHE